MHSLADSLQHLYIDGRCAPIVSIVLILVVSFDSFCTFEGRKGQCCLPGNTWDDVANIEGVY